MWGTTWRIVGVVGSERSQGVAKEAPIAIYLPLDAAPANAEALIVRTSGDLSAMGATLRGVIRELDPRLAVYGVEPLEQTLTNSLVGQRLMLLLTALASLAAIAIHGVLSVTVARLHPRPDTLRNSGSWAFGWRLEQTLARCCVS